MTSIEGTPFYNCCHLCNIFIDSLESWCKINFIGSPFPFHRMRYLHVKGDLVSEIKIPTSITEIKDYVFEGFSIENVVIHKNVKSIGNWSFCCSYLNSVTISNGVAYIGEGAFCDCNLTSVVLPKSVERIEKRAFSFCNNMTYITILGSPTIMDEAFKKCGELKDIYLYGEDIPKVHNAFEGIDISIVTLHVPSDTIKKYQNIEPWCKFGNIVPLI